MIGLAGQFAAVDENLTGRENVEMVGRLYHLGTKQARRRAGDVLERLRLTDAADRPVRTYSGGMRRRLDLGASLVAQPKVLLLDEPTTGLDPRSRAELWDFIRDLVSDGASVLLTTQYLEEADQLADGIVVLDHGSVIARGTSQELKDSIGGDVLAVQVAPEQVEQALTALAGLGHGEAHRDERAGLARGARRPGGPGAAHRAGPPARRGVGSDRGAGAAPAEPGRRLPQPHRAAPPATSSTPNRAGAPPTRRPGRADESTVKEPV